MERRWREIYSLHFLILSLFPPFLSISSMKICHILSQNINYGTFVTNGRKNLTYALWGNNSGSNSLRGSSASCVGLVLGTRSAAKFEKVPSTSLHRVIVRCHAQSTRGPVSLAIQKCCDIFDATPIIHNLRSNVLHTGCFLLDPFYRRGRVYKRKFCLSVCVFVRM